jgi:hypothetical protein
LRLISIAPGLIVPCLYAVDRIQFGPALIPESSGSGRSKEGEHFTHVLSWSEFRLAVGEHLKKSLSRLPSCAATWRGSFMAQSFRLMAAGCRDRRILFSSLLMRSIETKVIGFCFHEKVSGRHCQNKILERVSAVA